MPQELSNPSLRFDELPQPPGDHVHTAWISARASLPRASPNPLHPHPPCARLVLGSDSILCSGCQHLLDYDLGARTFMASSLLMCGYVVSCFWMVDAVCLVPLGPPVAHRGQP